MKFLLVSATALRSKFWLCINTHANQYKHVCPGFCFKMHITAQRGRKNSYLNYNQGVLEEEKNKAGEEIRELNKHKLFFLRTTRNV